MLLSDIIRRRATYGADRTALVYEGREITYGNLYERVRRCADVLASAGVGVGDRAAIRASNRPELLELIFGAAALGAIAVPLNYRLSSSETAQLIADCRPKVILYDGEPPSSDGVEAVCLALGHSADRPQDPRGLESGYESRMAAATARSAVADLPPDTEVLIQYTSGTTGAPKGVVSNHAGWIQSCMLEPYQKGLSSESVYLNVLPLVHTGGLKYVIHAIFTGAKTVLAPRFDADMMARLIRQHRVTHTAVAPTILRRLLAREDVRELRSLEYLNVGSEPMRRELIERARDEIGCKFTQGYGMTEVAGGSITFMGPESVFLDESGAEPASFGSVGRPLMDCDIRIVDAEGGECPVGESGEIIVRTERTLVRYWGSDQTPLDQDGFYHTGDQGRFDRAGYLYITGRLKDLIVSGGLNIYAREVELALERHEGVAEAYVIGLPDPEWGERVHAIVVAAPGASVTAEALTEWCRAELAHYKVPAQFDFLDSAQLPRTALGKVQKFRLRERLTA